MGIFMVLLVMVGVVRAQETEPGNKIFFNGVKAFRPMTPSIELKHIHTVGEPLDVARQAGLTAKLSFRQIPAKSLFTPVRRPRAEDHQPALPLP